MKKFIILILMINLMFAVKVYVNQECNGRLTPVNDGTNNFVSFIYPNIYEVVDYYGDYAYVELISGTKHVGKKGWIWTYVITNKNQIGSGGVYLRSEPTIKSKNKQYIRPYAKFKLIKLKKTWVKIKNIWGTDVYDWDQIWIWKGSTEPYNIEKINNGK